MKISYGISLALFLSSSLAHLYMSLRSYSLKADKAIGKTLCQIGDTWSCDQALTSIFSEIWTIPISNLGFALNIFCFFVLLFLKWTEKRKLWAIWVWVISLALALGSVVMFSISLIFIKAFCPFCTFCYILSFLVLVSLKYALPVSWSLSKKEFQELFSSARIWGLSSIPVIVILLHSMGVEAYSVKEANQMARSSFRDWKESPPVTFQQEPIISSRAASTSLHLVEFADYLCPYCAHTYFTLKTLEKIYPEIKIEYMAFPLSGCNSSGREPLSCYLWKSTFCAEKQNKGLYLQDQFYTNQKWFLSHQSQGKSVWEAKILSFLENPLPLINISMFQQCLSSSEATDVISQHIQEGRRLGIRGTPALFVNGKPLQPAALQQTLSRILKTTQSD